MNGKLQPKSQRATRHGLANATKTNQPERLASKLNSWILGPPPRLHALVSDVDMPGDRKEQPHAVICYRIGHRIRYVGHKDAMRAGRCQIHTVDPNPTSSHKLQAR